MSNIDEYNINNTTGISRNFSLVQISRQKFKNITRQNCKIQMADGDVWSPQRTTSGYRSTWKKVKFSQGPGDSYKINVSQLFCGGSLGAPFLWVRHLVLCVSRLPSSDSVFSVHRVSSHFARLIVKIRRFVSWEVRDQLLLLLFQLSPVSLSLSCH